MQKIKCLVYGISDCLGGIETYVITQLRVLNKEMFHFDFVYAKKEGEMLFSYEVKQNGSLIYNLRNNKEWKDFLKKHGKEYDIIIFNTPMPVFIPLLKSKKYGVKHVIVHSHNSRSDMPWYIKIFVPLALKYVQLKMRYIKAEKWACSELAGKFMFGKNAEYTVIRNAIDLDRFKFSIEARNKIRQQLGIDENTLLIGHVGRFDTQKNHKYVIDIFRGVLDKGINARLVLIGPEARKDIADKIRARCKVYNILDKVFFMGAINNVNEFYQAMDVFILPSLFEGLPISGLEAQVSGLPCYFSDTITRELRILDNACYIPIKQETIEDWVKAIISCNKDLEQRKSAYIKVGQAGYDINLETKRVEKLLGTLLTSTTV